MSVQAVCHIVFFKSAKCPCKFVCKCHYNLCFYMALTSWDDKQEHAKSANLLQRQNFNHNTPGIPIWIGGLIRIWIRMSARSVPKCCGCITLSASVISPCIKIISYDCMRNANEMSKKSYCCCNGEENEKVIRNPHADPDRSLKANHF